MTSVTLAVPGAPQVLVRDRWIPDELTTRLRQYHPRTDLGRIVRECFRYLPPELAATLLERIERIVVLQSRLAVVVYRGDGRVEDHGVVSEHVITNNGVAFLVDAWQNSVELENLRYHGFGSGTTAEAAGDTALVTEFTTEYNPNNTRPTGSLTEGASANVFRTVGTFSPDANVTVEEHGIFSQAATGGGTLWDRSLTGTHDLTGSVDSLEVTYDMTATSGG